MTACPTLETDRLTLRPLEESDLEAYTEMLMQPEVRRSLRLPRTYSRSDAWRGMAQWRGQWELRGSGQWAVTERATGSFVGRAGLHCPELPDWPGMEVGWTLHPTYWGRVRHRGGERSVAYAFEVLAVDEVFSVILPENQRSQAVGAPGLGSPSSTSGCCPAIRRRRHGLSGRPGLTGRGSRGGRAAPAASGDG